MQACLKLSPPAGDLIATLEAVAVGLVAVNLVWVQAQLAKGLEPPCCTDCAEPPWVAGGRVQWVDYHGAKPVGWCREYWDAPTMFAAARATCFDAACYDAARRISKGQGGTVRIRPIESALPGYQLHAWVETGDGTWKDPTAEMTRVDAASRRDAAGRVLRANVGGQLDMDIRARSHRRTRAVNPFDLLHRASASSNPPLPRDVRVRGLWNVGACGCEEGR